MFTRSLAAFAAAVLFSGAFVPASFADPVSHLPSVQVVPIGGGDVFVQGYFRKDGTYVQPHYRSAPDGNAYNNYSFPGNMNPYTGKVAPGNPDTYLRNHYGRGLGGTGGLGTGGLNGGLYGTQPRGLYGD